MISVIMPVFNGAATIAAAINSVLAQSYQRLELIVVNDGSTDSTLSIISSIGDPRLRIVNQLNGGVSAARNTGLRNAQGAYIAFIDADDVWRHDKLERQRNALLADRAADVAYCWVDYVDMSGNILHPDGRPVFAGHVYDRMIAHNFVHSGSNLMITRAAFSRCGGFCELFNAFEDWEFQLRLAKHCQFVCVPSAMVFYRMRKSSLTTRVLSMEMNYHRVAERVFAEAGPAYARLRRKNEAVTYEYLMSRAIQGFPTRRKGKLAFDFYGKAVRAWPPIIWQPYPKPWVLKRLLRAGYWTLRGLNGTKPRHRDIDQNTVERP